MDRLKEIEKKIKKSLNISICKIETIPQSGSSRIYKRLFSDDGKNLILCLSDNVEENQTFCSLAEIFHKNGLYVPEILLISRDFRWYVQEDLGNRNLLEFLNETSSAVSLDVPSDAIRRRKAMIERIIENLVKFQQLPEQLWERTVGFSPLDEELIRYDFNYCLTNFFGEVLPDYNSKNLDDDLDKLGRRLLEYPQELWGFMYRDFQSRNIMLKGEKPFYIDFQSGRKGPGIYDMVSFLWQAKARFSKHERNEFLKFYSELNSGRVKDAEKIISEEVAFWACFRMIQVLGAYGLRGLKEGKKHFIESIGLALTNFRELITDYGLKKEFPELSKIIFEINSF